MTETQLLHTVFSILPCAVCLFWLICFLVQSNRNDMPKRYFMGYIATCVVLYFCHALFFTVGLSYAMECLWTLCSLSVYPLFYGYLCRLTSSSYKVTKLLPWLLPGIVVALAKYFFPEAGMDKVRVAVFACQIIGVCYFGIKKLKAFDRELQSLYADTEDRDTTAVHHLLIAIIIVSILSGVANSVGKQFFGESLWLLAPISLGFSSLLFALSYICFNRDFTVDSISIGDGEGEESEVTDPQELTEQIGKRFEELMISQRFFIRKDLKIDDLVKEIGSNRTYVSNYINRTYHCSFSEYTNKLRIEYAKTLLASSVKGTKLSQIAEEAGFASEQSFYRNFKKIVGMTPIEWAKDNL